jgi:hypothetical protein
MPRAGLIDHTPTPGPVPHQWRQQVGDNKPRQEDSQVLLDIPKSGHGLWEKRTDLGWINSARETTKHTPIFRG